MLAYDGSPEAMDADWLRFFFGHCQDVSGASMQSMWSAILAREASGPGRFGKRSVQAAALLDARTAATFTRLAQLSMVLDGTLRPVLPKAFRPFPADMDTIEELHEMEGLGLVTVQVGGYSLRPPSMVFPCSYFDEKFTIAYKDQMGSSLANGPALFTRAGIELVPICGATADPEYRRAISEWIVQQGFVEIPI